MVFDDFVYGTVAVLPLSFEGSHASFDYCILVEVAEISCCNSVNCSSDYREFDFLSDLGCL